MACDAAVIGGGGGEGCDVVGRIVDDGDAVAVEGVGEVDAVGVGGWSCWEGGEGREEGCGEGGCEGRVERRGGVRDSYG